MRELRLWAAAAAGPPFAAGFYALAALRRGRSLHPDGIGYEGWLRVPDEGQPRPGSGVPRSSPARPVRPCFASLAVPACPSRCPTPSGWPSSCPTPTVPASTRICS